MQTYVSKMDLRKYVCGNGHTLVRPLEQWTTRSQSSHRER